jgi:HEPN domain-containing protein
VETRYPGDYEPVDESDYATAVEIAGKVLAWVEKNIEGEK